MSILTLTLISVGIFNIVFYPRKICKKRSYSPISTVKYEIYPFSRSYHVHFDFSYIWFQKHWVPTVLNSRGLQTMACHSLALVKYILLKHCHIRSFTLKLSCYGCSHRNTRVALLWQSPYACKAYDIYHRTLLKKMFPHSDSKGTWKLTVNKVAAVPAIARLDVGIV